ncbi:HEAT repeat domain-containing protein [Labrenzia sp. VG12]|uniref:HEAT repeat domain-containing protein n=1 Tax=Labrenzia sp. VG12 TaxID=2021862 RepID=UPI000B8BD9DD|nr:HEAT repeat domain-containing protein [Labrenzia sp. VG12]ASP36127.1 hypothetical protein CHH27_25120 [Labrenzia sp. VG12]
MNDQVDTEALLTEFRQETDAELRLEIVNAIIASPDKTARRQALETLLLEPLPAKEFRGSYGPDGRPHAGIWVLNTPWYAPIWLALEGGVWRDSDARDFFGRAMKQNLDEESLSHFLEEFGYRFAGRKRRGYAELLFNVACDGSYSENIRGRAAHPFLSDCRNSSEFRLYRAKLALEASQQIRKKVLAATLRDLADESDRQQRHYPHDVDKIVPEVAQVSVALQRYALEFGFDLDWTVVRKAAKLGLLDTGVFPPETERIIIDQIAVTPLGLEYVAAQRPDDGELTNRLMTLLTSPKSDPRMRLAATRRIALRGIRSKEIMDRLRDETPQIRRAAFQYLLWEQADDQDALQALVAALREETDSAVAKDKIMLVFNPWPIDWAECRCREFERFRTFGYARHASNRIMSSPGFIDALEVAVSRHVDKEDPQRRGLSREGAQELVAALEKLRANTKKRLCFYEEKVVADKFALYLYSVDPAPIKISLDDLLKYSFDPSDPASIAWHVFGQKDYVRGVSAPPPGVVFEKRVQIERDATPQEATRWFGLLTRIDTTLRQTAGLPARLENASDLALMPVDALFSTLTRRDLRWPRTDVDRNKALEFISDYPQRTTLRQMIEHYLTTVSSEQFQWAPDSKEPLFSGAPLSTRESAWDALVKGVATKPELIKFAMAQMRRHDEPEPDDNRFAWPCSTGYAERANRFAVEAGFALAAAFKGDETIAGVLSGFRDPPAFLPVICGLMRRHFPNSPKLPAVIEARLKQGPEAREKSALATSMIPLLEYRPDFFDAIARIWMEDGVVYEFAQVADLCARAGNDPRVLPLLQGLIDRLPAGADGTRDSEDLLSLYLKKGGYGTEHAKDVCEHLIRTSKLKIPAMCWLASMAPTAASTLTLIGEQLELGLHAYVRNSAFILLMLINGQDRETAQRLFEQALVEIDPRAQKNMKTMISGNLNSIDHWLLPGPPREYLERLYGDLDKRLERQAANARKLLGDPTA